MPILQIKEIIDLLGLDDIKCRIGRYDSDIPQRYRPYFEKWLGNRDGFIRMLSGSIDYVGSEDVVRMGPFHNIYCLVQNQYLVENDLNHQNLLNSKLWYSLNDGVVDEAGWSGSILASRLTKDQHNSNFLFQSLKSEVTRTVSVRVVNLACLIECRIWHPREFVFLYEFLDNIAMNIQDLLSEVHVGENMTR
ncbi:MAG: hypothetical protein WA390_04125 [Nitrososphaeraceae archaeon]|nr:hypothetical protein [Nitrososphaeraceae archaeon]MDW0137307.1 hypothetical protein [Nitrososphaeraceae archaeon]MDW0146097.1 hypothetical protein [Nitrososphaeraceae archaeon]MDW0148244.1 hypothetical protein [Nitrososphaeraceae archaeon]MDW0153733.1 hypothetical protein [Nitrososphaeraceae archaeon]